MKFFIFAFFGYVLILKSGAPEYLLKPNPNHYLDLKSNILNTKLTLSWAYQFSYRYFLIEALESHPNFPKQMEYKVLQNTGSFS